MKRETCITLLAAMALVDLISNAASAKHQVLAASAATNAAAANEPPAKILSVFRRSATPAPHKDHHSAMHNHLSRKVFDRACAASKDTIDEIVACLNNNAVLKTVKIELAAGCYKDAFGVDFDPKEMSQHKDLICNNRDKFESMTSCVYRKTAESVDSKELEKMTEAMVDVGLCIINALDG